MNKLKDIKQEYDALFNNRAIGIISVNHLGSIVTINPFALGQFGYSNELELIGKPLEVLIPSRFRDKHKSHTAHYHKNKPTGRTMGIGLDLFAVRKDGREFPVEISLSPYKATDGDYIIAFISDISVRKESEKALMELNTQLENKVIERTQSLTDALEKEKELNELKTRFLSMASHEFRTPLSTILSSSFLASKYTQTEEQPQRLKHHNRIVSSVNMLTDTLNDFLQIGKIEEGKMTPRYADIDIFESTKSLINEIQAILKVGQHLTYTHIGEAFVVLDHSMLKHIMMNLLSNAIKFSPDGAEIELTTELKEDEFIVSVKDSGIGISREDQQHLFGRFFRGANVSNIQGTGLGLHIVARYVELMDGKIDCKSELDKGTEFIVTFKIKKDDENNIAD
jgi:PAS domain S-box-containing protein